MSEPKRRGGFAGFFIRLLKEKPLGMLSREGRRFMEQAPWLALWPGLCLTLTVYSLNMFGDALRDLLDPRLRGGVGRMGVHGAKSVEKAAKKKLEAGAKK